MSSRFGKNVEIDGTLTVEESLTVQSGGASITGDTNITGTVTSVGNMFAPQFIQTSDAKYKSNLAPIVKSIGILKAITPQEFDIFGYRTVGVIAQELQKILPNLVVKQDNGDLVVNYIGLIAYLIAGFQEQQKKIEELENDVNTCNIYHKRLR